MSAALCGRAIRELVGRHSCVSSIVGRNRMKPRVKVKVGGCVRRQGDHILTGSVTVWDAIQKAGGFAKRPYGPAGPVRIRSLRKRDGVYFQRLKFDFRKLDARAVQLRDGDIVIVQWDVSGQPASAANGGGRMRFAMSSAWGRRHR